jgi:AcrR family transcriptional regulator
MGGGDRSFEVASDRPSKHRLKSERTRTIIMDAAEPIFAELGLAGASLRQIAAAAAVDLSLVAYHFHSKPALYNAVVDRILIDFTQLRMQLLDALERSNPNPSATDLFAMQLEAWFTIRFGPAPHQTRLILRGFNTEHRIRDGTKNDWPSDPFVERFIAALAKAAPERSAEYIHWTYHGLMGSLVYYMTSTDRIERLSGRYCHTSSRKEIRQAFLALVAGAFGS